MNKKFIYKLEDKNKQNKVELIVEKNTDILKEINHKKIAIIDFEAISFIMGNPKYTVQDFFKGSNNYTGAPISASLILDDGKSSKSFHFEIFSKINYNNGPTKYKKVLIPFLKEIVETIPSDYKIVVWGEQFEKIIFNYIIKKTIVDKGRKKQFSDILDLQKCFNEKINNVNSKLKFNVNFKNNKNRNPKKEERQLARMTEEYSSFSYDDFSLESSNEHFNDEIASSKRSNRSLDFIAQTIKLIIEDEHLLDMSLFSEDSHLFKKINSYFRKGRINDKFLNELKEYNNKDVEGILLIYNWIKNKLEELDNN